MSEKLRVHTLAKQLNVSSKVVIDKCKAEGLDIKNHMSTLSAGLAATIREWFSEGVHAMTVETTARVDLQKVRLKRKPKPPAEAAPSAVVDAPAEPVVPAEPVIAVIEPRPVAAEAPAEAVVVESPAPVEPEVPAPPPEAPIPELPAAEAPEAAPVAEAPAETAPAEIAPTEGEPPAEAAETQEEEEASVPELIVEDPPAPPPPAEPVKPAGPQNVPAPAKLAGPRVVRYEPVERDVIFRPQRSASPRRRPAASAPEVTGPPPTTGAPGRRGRGRVSEYKGGTAGAGAGAGRGRGRGQRGSNSGEKLKEWRDRDMAEFRERLSGATGRRIQSHRLDARGAGGGRSGPITKAEISEPFIAKEFCAAIGVPFVRLVGLLKREHNIIPNINAPLPKEVAELVALEFGIELTVKEAKTSLDLLVEEATARERPHMASRPPVITMLGHVDHGKTSLLDAIRRTGVAGGEDGGITQHLGSYHLVREGKAVTFLDTPGHAAFTAMRARGAQMTDIVVLVVAMDDGVMAQTAEAISHAKAAGVPIVVALNKCDLGDANANRIYGELAAKDLSPSEWGGETDVIHTSATKGIGIDELVQHLTDLAEIMELKADPTVDAAGTVIEAETREGVGSVATILVQEGTLRVGQVVLCGAAFGKVRALVDDAGHRIKQATPSIPVEVWGLDDVPEAGDKFYVVENLQRAGQIAGEVKQKRVQASRAAATKSRSLEDLFKQRAAGTIPELNLIIKADVSGSAAAIREVLEDLPSEEVSLNVRHCAVGGVTDSDVLLADACDGIIIGFRVVPGLGARHMAEEKGVDIRRYKVIYDVTDDIKRAMEGLLEPEQRIEQRATAEVRNVFRITKVGMVAGCYITDGTVHRNHFVRLIRDGVVIRDDCKLDSLRRFKDDAKEVRSGMECGIRLEGFEDVKPGDVIESYEIVKVPRKLKNT